MADFDFSGLSPSQQALLTFCGWDQHCGRPKPRRATVQPLLARGLVVLHPMRAGGTDPARYEVPIAVHAAWCAHCADAASGVRVLDGSSNENVTEGGNGV